MKRLFAIRHLVVLAVAAATTLMVSCFKDDIIELPSGKPSLPTTSEYIAFQADAQWADEDVISRNAATRNRVGKHDLISEDGELSLPMGVYVEEGICGTTDNGKTRGAVLSAIGDSFTVWASLTNGENTELFFPAEGELFENDGTSYKSDPAYFWPGAGTFSFTAVANAPDTGFTPNLNTAGTALESFTYTVPADATAQNDIVLATLKDVDGGANATQALNFKHIMSAVQFKVGETMAAGVIKSIKLNNIKTTGTYNVIPVAVDENTTIPAGTWTADTSNKGSYSVSFSETDANGNYEPNGKTDAIINQTSNTLLLMPQVLDADAEVVIEFIYDNAPTVVKELRANIAMKENTTERNEWKAATTTYYELSVDENYNLTITPKGDILDAHYVMTDITVNVDTETDQAWTLTVEATNISGDDDNVSIEYKDKLNTLIKNDGYWINNIVEGTTTTSARGGQTVTGTTKGAHTITVFIPENITAEERKITLTLSLDSDPDNAKKTEYLYQMCPYWDTDKGFGWEKVENNDVGEYGFTWTLVECYIFTYKCEGIGILRYDIDSAKKLVTDLMDTYGLPTEDANGNDTTAPGYGGFITIDTFTHYEYESVLGYGWWQSKGTRIAVIIDYTKLNFDNMMSDKDGLANTKGFFAASSLLQFQDALHNMQKVNESGNAFRHLSDSENSSGKFFFNNYTRWDGSNAMFQNNGGNTNDASGILQYVIRRNAFNLVTRTTADGENKYTSLDMNANNIKWYLPAVRQFDDAILNWATGDTTFKPSNFWSSTAAANNEAYAGGTTVSEPRTNKHQVVVQRIVTPIPQAATVTVDNSSIAGEENGDTNNWIE